MMKSAPLRLTYGFLLALAVFAARAPAAQNPASAPLEIEYHLRLLRPSTHLAEVGILARQVSEPSLDFALPAWSPGRYAIYDFAKNVQEFEALDAASHSLPWTQTDKQTWRVDARDSGSAVRVRYKVFGNDLNGTFSQIDPTHANVNGASVYMYVAGHKPDPVTLAVEAPADSKVISGFSLSTEQRTFQAASYDRQIVIQGVLAGAGCSEALEDAAHEFFHVWNVKRLRPAALGPFYYAREDYTQLLWFAEGVTSYFACVNLLRSGAWDRKEFLKLLA